MKLAVRAYARDPSREHAEAVKLALSRKRELDARAVIRARKSQTTPVRNV